MYIVLKFEQAKFLKFLKHIRNKQGLNVWISL